PCRRNEAFFALRQTLIEDRKRPAHASRTYNVGEAERHPVQPAELHIILRGCLRNRVAAVHRIDGMVERDRLLERLDAVAERGLKIDQTLAATIFCSLDDIRSTHAIGERVVIPIVGILVGRSGMNDSIWLKVTDE